MKTGDGHLKIVWRDLRPQRRPLTSRWAILTVAWVVLLIAAIALSVNRPGHDSSSGQPPATKPVSPGTDHSERGAEAAAARYAIDLGSEVMFRPQSRHQLVESVADPADLATLQKGFDTDYTSAFNAKLGLTPSGSAPAGETFISRAMPAGVIVKSYNATEARVAVWCSGLLGLTGSTSLPTSTNWFTMTEVLKWTADGWRFSEFTQQDGPDPSRATDFGQAPPL